MHAVGIISNRQVLDNKTSMEYRQEIMETGMTYQVPSCGGRFPNKTNMAEINPQQKLPNLAAHHSKNVNKFFPESDETQQGHMRDQRQGVLSTKPKKNDKPQRIQITVEEEKEGKKLQGEDTRNTKPIKKENDILIEVYSPIKLENFHTSRAKGTGT